MMLLKSKVFISFYLLPLFILKTEYNMNFLYWLFKNNMTHVPKEAWSETPTTQIATITETAAE